jgi:hypothetical protein
MVGILVGVIIVGFIKIILKCRKYVDNYNFVIDYKEKTLKLLTDNITNEDYGYLLSNITKLSNAMGIYGIIDYQPPFANYIHKNYSIVNLIVNYQDSFMKDELQLAVKTMQIYLGACNQHIDELKKKIKNPFTLFAEGFRFIFNIPLFILNSLGIISDRFYYKLKDNGIYYFVQNIVGLIGFISSVIGLVQGKDFLIQCSNKVINFIASVF